MDQFLQAIITLNWQTVIGIGVIVWYFTKDLRQSNIEILREIKSMHDDMKLMNTRLSRVEGVLFGKEIYKNIGE